jgi:hypothetical protein
MSKCNDHARAGSGDPTRNDGELENEFSSSVSFGPVDEAHIPSRQAPDVLLSDPSLDGGRIFRLRL